MCVCVCVCACPFVRRKGERGWGRMYIWFYQFIHPFVHLINDLFTDSHTNAFRHDSFRKIMLYNNRIQRRYLRFFFFFFFFLQSPHIAENCLQYVRSSSPGAIVCKSRATHRALITCKCHGTCHLVRRDSSAIEFDRV